jgi:2-methylcitrate dehydratase PrpD
VTIAGAAEDATRILLGVSGSSSGPSLVFGHARRIGALDAALVNGTASHALDFDDCNNTLGGHPSVPILPESYDRKAYWPQASLDRRLALLAKHPR